MGQDRAGNCQRPDMEPDNIIPFLSNTATCMASSNESCHLKVVKKVKKKPCQKLKKMWLSGSSMIDAHYCTSELKCIYLSECNIS